MPRRGPARLATGGLTAGGVKEYSFDMQLRRVYSYYYADPQYVPPSVYYQPAPVYRHGPAYHAAPAFRQSYEKPLIVTREET